MSFPTVVQRNNSQQYRNEQNPNAVLFNSLIQTQETNNWFDSHQIQHSTTLTLVPLSFVLHHHNPFTSRLLRKIHLHITKQPSFLRLLNNLANQTFIKTRISFRVGPVTEANSFIHALKYKQKDSHLNTNFNGNPLKYNEWVKILFKLVHNNISLTDTHRITYLQNSFGGDAKEKIQLY